MALGRCRLQAIPCQEARTPDTLSSWHTGGRARHLSSCAAGVVTHGTPPSSLWLAHGTPPSALWLADDTPPRGVPTSSLTRTHAPSTLWLAHDTRRLLRRLLSFYSVVGSYCTTRKSHSGSRRKRRRCVSLRLSADRIVDLGWSESSGWARIRRSPKIGVGRTSPSARSSRCPSG